MLCCNLKNVRCISETIWVLNNPTSHHSIARIVLGPYETFYRSRMQKALAIRDPVSTLRGHLFHTTQFLAKHTHKTVPHLQQYSRTLNEEIHVEIKRTYYAEVVRKKYDISLPLQRWTWRMRKTLHAATFRVRYQGKKMRAHSSEKKPSLS